MAILLSGEPIGEDALKSMMTALREGDELCELPADDDDLTAAEAKIERLRAAGDALARASESGMNPQLLDQWEGAKQS